MNREKLLRQQFENMFIAFAIAWLSMSSIVDFHIHKIYEKDIFGNIEFIKTDSKKTTVFKTDITQKVDHDSDLCEFSYHRSLNQQVNHHAYSIVSVFRQQQFFKTAIFLRGPPSIKV